jgi:hypothetical protein
VIEFGVVSVDVIPYHAQLKQFLVGLLLFGYVYEGGLEAIFEFCPEDFVSLCKIVGGVQLGF